MKNINYYKKNISETKITILGCGKSGIAAANLGNYLGAKIFLSDNRKKIRKNQLTHWNKNNFEIGEHSNKCLDSDIIIKSPGINPNSKIIKTVLNKTKIPIISEIEFASWFTKSPIIGITGSNGKSTTVKLLYDFFITKYKNTMLGGNIGIPFSNNVQKEIKLKIPRCIHIVELSSFQLENIHTFSPEVACILNLSKDHLDRYSSIKEYFNTKFNIINNISEKSFFVYNEENKNLKKLINKNKKNYIAFGLNNNKNNFYLKNMKIISTKNKKNIINCDKINLKGKHNYQNIVAALEISKIYKINFKSIMKKLEIIKPLKHRMELVPSNSNISFINDSKGTNINSTINAIKSYNKNIILIMGGYSKGKTKYKEFINTNLKHIKFIICYGDEGENIFQELSQHFKCKYIINFTRCVKYAIKIAKQKEIILLSPACASFDQFKSFEERGEKFKAIIKNYNFKSEYIA